MNPEIGGDIQLALALASGRPTGEAADALRVRMRNYITTVTAPARRYADSLPPGPLRAAAEKALADGAQLASGTEPDQPEGPAEELRRLARCVDYLTRCAAAAPISDVHTHVERQLPPAAPPPPGAPPA